MVLTPHYRSGSLGAEPYGVHTSLYPKQYSRLASLPEASFSDEKDQKSWLCRWLNAESEDDGRKEDNSRKHLVRYAEVYRISKTVG
jgi:hypothetical protein